MGGNGKVAVTLACALGSCKVLGVAFQPVPAIVAPPAQITRPKVPDVKFAPTPQSVVEAMLELARVTPADVVYDLGSGDGRIPITAAAKFGARGVGIEIDPLLVRRSEDNLATAGVRDRVRFVNQDFFETDLSEATVVTLFLMPSINEKLMPKLKRELRPGARIVANHFNMGDEWPADQTREVDGLTIYLWTIRGDPR